jgi:hypothetical protein
LHSWHYYQLEFEKCPAFAYFVALLDKWQARPSPLLAGYVKIDEHGLPEGKLAGAAERADVTYLIAESGWLKVAG